VQVDLIKPTLKAPGTKRLKLEYDGLLSDFAFKFNLRCYNKETTTDGADSGDVDDSTDAGAAGMGLHSSTVQPNLSRF
jgi:hypothetical protein